jgi:hypothetical protein
MRMRHQDLIQSGKITLKLTNTQVLFFLFLFLSKHMRMRHQDLIQSGKITMKLTDTQLLFFL